MKVQAISAGVEAVYVYKISSASQMKEGGTLLYSFVITTIVPEHLVVQYLKNVRKLFCSISLSCDHVTMAMTTDTVIKCHIVLLLTVTDPDKQNDKQSHPSRDLGQRLINNVEQLTYKHQLNSQKFRHFFLAGNQLYDVGLHDTRD